jgi:hypothetical protein
MGIVDLDHVSGVIRPIYRATVAIQDDIMHIADFYYSVKTGISEDIISRDELDVGVAADCHVIGDGDVGLGKSQNREEQGNNNDTFHGYEGLEVLIYNKIERG